MATFESFDPRRAALSHAGRREAEDAMACGLVYVGDQLRTLNERLAELNLDNHLSTLTGLLQQLDVTVNDRLIELTEAV